MTWDDEFFESRRLTSKLKHYVLRRYVKEFAYHLGTVYHVDGFAGAGEYGTGENREAGSPILIARLDRNRNRAAQHSASLPQCRS